MYGYCGRVLHVDLTRRKCHVEEPSEDFYRRHIGGSSLGVYALTQMPPRIDAFDPRKLVFATSATTGHR